METGDEMLTQGLATILTELYSLSPCQELTNCGRINHLSIGDEKPQFPQIPICCAWLQYAQVIAFLP